LRNLARVQVKMEREVKAFEVREVWRRYKEGGDQSARERLVVAYSSLAKFVVGRTGARLPPHVAAEIRGLKRP
jgi:DNA-directed RNA polymerase specialized sigma subunit